MLPDDALQVSRLIRQALARLRMDIESSNGDRRISAAQGLSWAALRPGRCARARDGFGAGEGVRLLAVRGRVLPSAAVRVKKWL